MEYTGIITQQKVNDKLHKFGSSQSYVKFISKNGVTVDVKTDTDIDKIPSYRVDRQTYRNFRYGTWYYNAKELREYADEHGIPVLAGYSSSGCSPCKWFHSNYFNSDVFQTWVKNSPYLFCRVESDVEGSFSDRQNFPQDYYIDNVWAKEKYGDSNVYIPVFFWYWKRKGDAAPTVFDLSSFHFDAKTNTPPWSMQQMMNMTDDKFSGYTPSDMYKPYEISDLYSSGDKMIGRFYTNLPLSVDENQGIAFAADEKKPVTEYRKLIDIKGYNSVNVIKEGQTVQFAPNTYYVYDTSTRSPYIDEYGVIFRVDREGENNVIKYILETHNNYDENQEKQIYNCGQWYNLSSASDDIETFNGIVNESEEFDYPLVILKMSSNDVKSDEFRTTVKNSTEFSEFVTQSKQTYFIDAQSDNYDFNSGLGGAVKEFQTKDFRNEPSEPHFPSWNNDVPKILVYLGCQSCSDNISRPLVKIAEVIDVEGKTAVELINTLKGLLG